MKLVRSLIEKYESKIKSIDAVRRTVVDTSQYIMLTGNIRIYEEVIEDLEELLSSEGKPR